MKKIVFFFLMTILIASCHQEELSSVPDEPEGKQPVFEGQRIFLVGKLSFKRIA